MRIYVKKLHPDAQLPEFQNPLDACMDLRSVEDVSVWKDDAELVRTGIAIQLPPDYEAQIRPRSGLAAKHGITVLNSPGTIDAGYRGEICVVLCNLGPACFEVKKGDRIAQMAIRRVYRPEIVEVDDLDKSERGQGGFGSTGAR
jgi:dUTP pyrophosphatase